MNAIPIEIVTKIDAVKNKLKQIKNNSKVEFGSTKFKYPDLNAIKSVLDPLLDENNLSMITIGTEHSFSDSSLAMYIQFTDLDSGKTAVQKFETKIDTKQKNAVQCTGATTTYMQRYSKKIVFDLEFTDDDPDHQKNMVPEPQNSNSIKAQLVAYQKANKVSNADILKAMKEVANKSQANKLTQKEFDKVINKLDTMQRVN